MTPSPSSGRDPARWRLIGQGRRQSRPRTVRLQLDVHERVVTQALEEIKANPTIEVGGKFLGYVEGAFSAGNGWVAGLANLRVTVVAYMDAGPGKRRSAVYHYSDTDYQFRLFQEIIRDYPDLLFLGIWHSHHPNGLDVLSDGDTDTGSTTVNNPGHEQDFLLSSLAVDMGGLREGRHFVFLRGHQGFLEIDPSSVRIVGGPNPVADRLAEIAQRLGGLHAERPEDPVDQQSAGTAWMTTSEGKAVLAEDRVWLTELGGMRSFLRSGSLVWRGGVEVAGIPAECEYTYPAGFPNKPPVVDVRSRDGGHAVRFTLPAVSRRREGFEHALEAFAALVRTAHAEQPANDGPADQSISDG
ncbi:hypothetical protein J5X84_15065 [Streptosporangiaceae bacterium NEAU-GS5]|nr:hypothetical protein [Streptosporangiaceae bacterium NEAU-GS5]